MDCRIILNIFALAGLFFLILHPIEGDAFPWERYRRSIRTMEKFDKSVDFENKQLPAGRHLLDNNVGGEKIKYDPRYEEEAQPINPQNEDNGEPDLSVIPLRKPLSKSNSNLLSKLRSRL